MTREEAINRYKDNAKYERTHGNLQGCLEFIQLAKWLKDYKKLLGAIEEIKAEIKEEMNDCTTTSIYTRLGFETALNIIDKHTSGKEET